MKSFLTYDEKALMAGGEFETDDSPFPYHSRKRTNSQYELFEADLSEAEEESHVPKRQRVLKSPTLLEVTYRPRVQMGKIPPHGNADS